MNDPVPLSMIVSLLSILPTILLVYLSTALQRLNSAQIERLFELEETQDRFGGFNLSQIKLSVYFASVIVELLFLVTLFTWLFSGKWLSGNTLGFFVAAFLVEFFSRVIMVQIFPLHLREYLRSWEKALIMLCSYLFLPVAWITDKFSNWLQGVSKPSNQNDRMAQAEETIKSIIDAGEKDGVFLNNEGEMLQSIVELSETIVREVMTPRIDLESIEISNSIDDFVQKVVETGYSKIPVYKDRVDEIVGILYAKDVLKYWGDDDSDVTLDALKRPATFVPESKRISFLMQEFQKEKKHLAIVVDEFGGVAGLVTIEDLLEEIVGEIQDEYDQEEAEIRQTKDDSWEVAAKIDLDELTEEIDVEFPEDNYETLGGFMFHLFGRVPVPGESQKYQNVNFTIVNADERRIEVVRIDRLKPENYQDEEKVKE